MLTVAIAFAILAAQDAAFQDLRAELAAKIAASGATEVSVSCEQNLRERACVAEVSKGGARDVVVVTRPLTSAASPALTAREPALGIDARPLFAQRAPILDVAPAPDHKRLIVLEPSSLSIREWTAAGGVSDAIDSRPVSTTRAWPRDLRGRLQTTRLPFDVFLPGVTCRADLDPLRLSCTDASTPWPGLANGGVEAARNSFTTPEGRTFVSAAPIVGDGSAQRWLIADQQGALMLLDDRRSPIAKLAGTGSDVAAVRAPCAPGPFVLVSRRAAHDNDVDELRLFRLAAQELVPAASPLRLQGTLTALWSDEGTALAVVRDAAANRYEAFQISVSCAR